MITVTGATGHLGRLVVAELLARDVPADGITAAVRTPAKAADLGVRVAHADYDDPATLAAAFAGTDRLLFISSSNLATRRAEHAAVVRAATEAGVGHVAYTSILRADSSGMLLAEEHLRTEEAIRASGLPYTLLRNGWYLENYTAQVDNFVGSGVMTGSSGDGLVSAAARADYAAAAAVVLSTDGHQGAVYELAGDDAFTVRDFAAELSRQSGKPVRYEDRPVEVYAAELESYGVPAAAARTFADADLGVARGQLHDTNRQLSTLIGRPTTPLAQAIAAALG